MVHSMASPADVENNFAAVPELFGAQIKRSTRNRRIFQVLRNGGSIFFGIGMLGAVGAGALAAASLACLSVVVISQCNEKYQEWRTKETNLKLVPTGSSQEFEAYLREQRTEHGADKRLDNVSSELGRRLKRSVVTASAAGGALVLALISGGSVLMPIVFGIIAAAEANQAYGYANERKGLQDWRSSPKMNARKLADLADRYEDTLNTTEVIRLAESPKSSAAAKTSMTAPSSPVGAQGSNDNQEIAQDEALDIDAAHGKGGIAVRWPDDRKASPARADGEGVASPASTEAGENGIPMPPRRGPRI
jgi:hypothetical protein